MITRRHALQLAALAAASTSVGLGACSASSSPASNGPVSLSYATWDVSTKETMEKVARAFEATHPNVTIEVQIIPWDQYWTKLQTAATGGSAPDVFWMSPINFQLYASNGILAPLQGVDAAAYPEVLLAGGTQDGVVYGSPKDINTIGVYYNTALFDAAGIDHPSAGWTWADYREIATALTDESTRTWGTVAELAGQTGYYNTIAQAGGYVISPDGKTTGYGSPEALAGIEFWTQLITDGVSPTFQQMTDTAAGDMFTSGKIGMIWNGSWIAGTYAETALGDGFDIAPLPEGPTGHQSTTASLVNVAFAKSPHVETAAEFAVFASGQEASQIQAESGAIIPAYNGTQETWVSSMPEYELSVFVDALETAVTYPASKNTAVWNKHEVDILSQVWLGAVEPAAGLQDLAAKMQTALDAENNGS